MVHFARSSGATNGIPQAIIAGQDDLSATNRLCHHWRVPIHTFTVSDGYIGVGVNNAQGVRDVIEALRQLHFWRRCGHPPTGIQ